MVTIFKFLLVVAWLSLSAIRIAFADDAERAEELLNQYRRAIVKIHVDGKDKNGMDRHEEGTGFFVFSSSKWSFVLTATHVLGSSETDKNPDWQINNGAIQREITLERFDEHGDLMPIKAMVSVGPPLVERTDISILMFNEDGYPTLPLVKQLIEEQATKTVVLLAFRKGQNTLATPLKPTTGALQSFNTYSTNEVSSPGESGGPWIELKSGLVFSVAREVHTDNDYIDNQSTPVGPIRQALQSYYPSAADIHSVSGTALERDDEVVWKFIENSEDAKVFIAFKDRFPSSPLVEKADARLTALQSPPSAELKPNTCGQSLPAFRPSGRAVAPLSSDEMCSIRPGDQYRECLECPSMIVLPQGSFTMGSPGDEVGRYGDEGPQHVVTITKLFGVAKFPVTRKEYGEFVREEKFDPGNFCRVLSSNYNFEALEGFSWLWPGYPQADSHPVTCVNWNDAQAYVSWLSKKTGHQYRLLSESEWEYAARGRTEPGRYPAYFFGDDPRALCTFANSYPLSRGAHFLCDDGYRFTSPVGTYYSNPFGLYDILGNVLEWTQDCHRDNYNGAPLDGSADEQPNCPLRVLRGGSWDGLPRALRSAFRRRSMPDTRRSDFGFRVAETLLR